VFLDIIRKIDTRSNIIANEFKKAILVIIEITKTINDAMLKNLLRLSCPYLPYMNALSRSFIETSISANGGTNRNERECRGYRFIV